MTDPFRIAVRRFDGFEAAIRQQWDDFIRVTGSTAEVEIVPLDLIPLVDTLFTRNGLKDGTWDIAFLVTDWIAEAVANGSLLDLAPLMANDPIPDYPDAWPASLTGFQQVGEALYGLPYHDGPECLLYRTDLFSDLIEQETFADTHGFPLRVPETWDEFETVARFFTRPDEGRYGTLFAGFPDGHNTMYDFCIQLWTRGGELHDHTGRPTIASPAAIDGLDFYRRLMSDRSVTPPGLEQIDSVQSGGLFNTGNIAMMVNWFGFAALAEQPDSAVQSKVGIAPVPATKGSASASLNVYWVLGIGAGSRQPDLAWAFLRHCVTPPMDKLTTMAGGIGCRTSTWQDPDVNQMIPFYHRLTELHDIARELPRSVHLPALVQIIDRAVHQALTKNAPSEWILLRAQHEADGIRL